MEPGRASTADRRRPRTEHVPARLTPARHGSSWTDGTDKRVKSDTATPRCCTGPVIHVPRLAVAV